MKKPSVGWVPPKRGRGRPRVRPVIPGFSVRTTPKSRVRIVRIEHIADPDKRAPGWLDEARRMYKSEAKFRREFLLDWTSSDTGPIYPEFRELHAKGLVQLKAPGLVQDENGTVTVYRGWDFGLRFPAVVWLQRSPKSGRTWIMREVMPEGLNVYELRDLVMALSGQIHETALPERAEMWWQRIKDEASFGHWPSPPWFGSTGRPIRWVDYAGHEALQTSALVETAPEEHNAQAILGERGLVLTAWASNRRSREDVFRKLWMVQPDGYPLGLVDPACRILTAGFLGGICYPKPTPANPRPDTSAKDGYYEHLHDAAGYVVINQVPIAGTFVPEVRPAYTQGPQGRYGEKPARPKEELLGFHDAWADIG